MLNSLIRILTIWSFIFAGAFVSLAQKTVINAIDSQNLKRHLTYLSSDSLQGRAHNTEIPGLDMAAEYIAKTLRTSGVKSNSNSYFQSFSLLSSRHDSEKTFLKITNNKGSLIYETKSIFGLPGSAELQIQNAKIVIAGFGRDSRKKKQNDFNGMDVRGKVVLIAAGTPESFCDGNSFVFDFHAEKQKAERALKAGAAAVLLINSPHDKDRETFARLQRRANYSRYKLNTEISKKPAGKMFAFTEVPVADMLFGNKGAFAKHLAKISKKGNANSIEINNLNVDIAVKQKVDTFEIKNVCGIIEGSDPKLKEEYVVFMAHYDHLGMDKNGKIYNGADDNGSGMVTLLEVARAFQTLHEKPKRSLVFLWPAAEEIGIFGSQYYVENPIFPLEKTVACINIDMAGRVFEPRDTVWKGSPKMVKDFNGLFTLTNDIWPDLKTINSKACSKLGLVPDYGLPSYFLRSSDHYSFHKNGIPIINYSTGYHADYHKVTDEISKINFDKMKRVAHLCFLTGLEIANRETITF